MEIAKTSADSLTIMTEMVMPNDTNALNNLMGGNLLRWMDVAGGICARRHANATCVTTSVDNVSFKSPIHLGEIVTITAKVSRAFNTSLEVHLTVHAEDNDQHRRRKCNEAYLTFVGLDTHGYKIPVPKFKPTTEEEQKHYDGALRRRELRLILAGKMQPSQSTELKSLFNQGS